MDFLIGFLAGPNALEIVAVVFGVGIFRFVHVVACAGVSQLCNSIVDFLERCRPFRFGDPLWHIEQVDASGGSRGGRGVVVVNFPYAQVFAALLFPDDRVLAGACHLASSIFVGGFTGFRYGVAIGINIQHFKGIGHAIWCVGKLLLLAFPDGVFADQYRRIVRHTDGIVGVHSHESVEVLCVQRGSPGIFSGLKVCFDLRQVG